MLKKLKNYGCLSSSVVVVVVVVVVVENKQDRDRAAVIQISGDSFYFRERNYFSSVGCSWKKQQHSFLCMSYKYM